MTKSPLRWAGSKRSLLPAIRSAMPLKFDRYIEPFMGSACVFFDFAPGRALLSDFNADLVHFFDTLKDSPDALYDAFASWASDGSEYYEVRAVNAADLNSATRAGRFLYLNRFAFNGVYRTNRKGEFNVPRGARTGEAPTRSELLQASSRLQHATIAHADYLATTAMAARDDFVYLDPPYRNDARPTYGEYGYGSFGSESDVASLASELERLNNTGARVMLSFNDDTGLEEALAGWDVTKVARRRNVAAAASARTTLKGEILATNYSRRPANA